MSMPAGTFPPGSWTEAGWARALDARPDLLDRLNAGDLTALAEMLELQPHVSAEVRDARQPGCCARGRAFSARTNVS